MRQGKHSTKQSSNMTLRELKFHKSNGWQRRNKESLTKKNTSRRRLKKESKLLLTGKTHTKGKLKLAII
jgi:hypothetical protein